MSRVPKIAVVGSVNLDIVAFSSRLPAPGETVTGATLGRYPGGKGANQALAAARLGAEVTFIAAVGADAEADLALAMLRAQGIDLRHCRTSKEQATGVALITVAESGENQIVVAPGANRTLSMEGVAMPASDALICQLEVPEAALVDVAQRYSGLLCINLAPAREVPDELLSRADVMIVNETEADFYGERLHGVDGIVAVTRGAGEARLYRGGNTIAACRPPGIDAVDTTAAGDAFSAALTIALVDGRSPEQALEFACAAGALAATKAGAQPSLPTRAEVDALLSDDAQRP